MGERLTRLLEVKGKRSVLSFHRELGKVMWDDVGMARSEANLKRALQAIPQIREDFWRDVSVPGGGDGMNPALEDANRLSDFLEFAELICHDALDRDESCGAHFREEHQTPDGEAQRDDERYSHVSAWEYQGTIQPPVMHKEPLTFEFVKPSVRSYK